MATRYEYEVNVTHYVSFYDEDVVADGSFGGDPDNVTDSDRENFAQYNWGSEYDTDFSTDGVSFYDSKEAIRLW